MMNREERVERRIGLWGATGVGVGAIVGGGILALAGAAFAATGPSAMVAFALNGVIALLTALSFAEVASKFPQSGGTYTFARKVLSVEAAFCVGGIVWFASIGAAVLYALGFGRFASAAIAQIWDGSGDASPAWLTSLWAARCLAVAAIVGYSVGGAALIAAASATWGNCSSISRSISANFVATIKKMISKNTTSIIGVRLS